MLTNSGARAIILADDNPDDLFFSRRALAKAAGATPIVTCVDGKEVAALLTEVESRQEALPQMVLLDIKMPEMDGFATLKWIRARESLKDVRVVMLSGSNEARDKALAKSLGADDYLVKYPTVSDFTRVLASTDARN